MAIRYNMQVVNISTHLNIRSGAGTQYPIVGSYSNGNTFIADGTAANGSITWYHIENTNNWCAGNSSGGVQYLKIIADLSGSSSGTPTSSAPKAEKKVKGPTKISAVNIENTIGDLNSNSKLGVPKYKTNKNKATTNKSSITGSAKVDKDLTNNTKGTIKRNTATEAKISQYIRITSSNYPKVTKHKNSATKKQDSYDVNYNMNIKKSIKDSIEAIKSELETPTSMGRNTLNTNVHRKFNRFQKEFPDLYLRTSRAVVIFTRPDLNLFKGDDATINAQIKNDPRDYYALLKDRDAGRLLTENGGGHKALRGHNFNPLLSNLAQSLEIQDDSVDTVDMGETFTGYKMQYSKHNIKSITAGQLNIRFRETFDLSVTSLHQIWVDYQSNVYKGIFKPKREHIWRRELDYACNIYYFLLDTDGETIKFWSKYYGCFPVNVPKSTFSYDSGASVSIPELSVTYNYIYKSDLEPRTLVEFNNDAGNSNKVYKAMPTYVASRAHSYKTWSGVPYIDSFAYSSGISNPSRPDKYSQGYKLKYREPSS